MTRHSSIRIGATALLAGLSMILTGCFLSPGKFTSELVLMEDNRFTFTYEGEIFFLGLADLAEAAGGEEFEPYGCFDDEKGADRECTEEELAEQRAQWEEMQAQRAAEQAEQAEQMAAMMGGIDPNDPEASKALAEMLLRQEGWERVEDKGDGLFDVTYSVSGELSHDFIFPVIEDFPLSNPFVQIFLRDGDVVRVNAPGFSANGSGSPMGGMMSELGGLGGLGAAMGQSGGSGGEMPDIPVVEGTFTIITNGDIRANNTDEGPSTTASGETLQWEISPRTTAAPTALIDMSR